VSNGRLTNITVRLPDGEPRLVKVEADQTLRSALEPQLSGHDRELLESGKLILHTSSGQKVPLDFQGRDLTPGRSSPLSWTPSPRSAGREGP